MSIIADTVFSNGPVITVDPTDRVCEAVAVRGNRIVHVGDAADMKALIGPETRVIDLKGRCLLPGFIDVHCHPGLHASVKIQIPCSPRHAGSIEELKAAVKRRAADTPKGGWILGWGYDHTALREQRHPNRWDLDQAAPEHKVFLSRTCGHIAAVNSRVLEAFGMSSSTPDPPGGKIERDREGQPTGVLFEKAKSQIQDHIRPSLEDLKKGLPLMNQDFLSRGITSAEDASGWDALEIRAFQEAARENLIQIRLHFMVRLAPPEIKVGDHFLESGLFTGFGNDKLRLGALKLMVDGSGSGGSAAMREPYPDNPENHGILWLNQEELDNHVLLGHLAGYQVAVHAIGDRDVDMTLQSFERALKAYSRPDHRHRIEHCGFVDEAMLARIHQLGVVPVLGLPFLYELGDAYLTAFGHDRLENAYPLKRFVDRGVVSPLSSDTPVIDPNPLHGIYFALSRKTKSGQSIFPAESVDLMTAIRSYTAFSAYATFEEHLKGSLEPGKLADLIVLSGNILETPVDDLLDLKVGLTMVDGNVVYER